MHQQDSPLMTLIDTDSAGSTQQQKPLIPSSAIRVHQRHQW
jgi:hypothetical protein